jgi:hypothetical protein
MYPCDPVEYPATMLPPVQRTELEEELLLPGAEKLAGPTATDPPCNDTARTGNMLIGARDGELAGVAKSCATSTVSGVPETRWHDCTSV